MSVITVPNVGTISSKQISAWFDKAAKQLDETVDGRDKARGIKGEFNEVRTMMERVELGQLNHRQQRIVVKLLTVTLPKWVSGYIATIYRDGSERAYVHPIVNKQRCQIISKISKLHVTQSSREIRASLSFELERTAFKQLAPSRKEAAAFPDTTSLHLQNAEISEACDQLHENWLAARSHPLIAEEEYLLDQIAAQYLPEALGLYGSVHHEVDEEILFEAQELVLRQIALLNAQVEQLLLRHSGDALTALRAHTEFIESIAQRTAPSRLGLPAKF